MSEQQGIPTVKEALAQVAAEQAAAEPQQQAPVPVTEPDPEDVAAKVAPEAAPPPAQEKPGSYAREWARVQRLEKQAKEIAAKAESERKAAEAARDEATKLARMAKEDPAAFLMQHGGADAYQAATRKFLDQQETPDERLARIERENAELKGLVPKVRDEIRQEINNERASAAWVAYEREVEAETSRDDFVLIRELDLVDETKQLAVEWYSQHGEALTARQAAEKMNEYVSSTLLPQLAKSERLKQELVKAWGLDVQKPQPSKRANKTLTNNLTTNVPVDDILPADKVLSAHEETRRVLRAMGVATRE